MPRMWTWPGFPFGIAVNAEYRIQELELQAGDRLVFLTDGILERNATDVNALELLTETRHLHPREAVQALTQAVVKACGASSVMTQQCCVWTGTAAQPENATPARERIGEQTWPAQNVAAARNAGGARLVIGETAWRARRRLVLRADDLRRHRPIPPSPRGGLRAGADDRPFPRRAGGRAPREQLHLRLHGRRLDEGH